MNTKLSGAFALIFFFFFFSACQSYKKVPYLQDAEILKQANTQVAPVQDARLIPGDEVSILVSTSDPVVSQPFNAQGSTFLLDDQGNINYPVLGKLPLNGLTTYCHTQIFLLIPELYQNCPFVCYNASSHILSQYKCPLQQSCK